MDKIKTWEKRAEDVLVGRRIRAVRYFTEDERASFGWTSSPLVIFLDDGTFIYPTSDDEGNEAGALHTNVEDLLIIPVV